MTSPTSILSTGAEICLVCTFYGVIQDTKAIVSPVPGCDMSHVLFSMN